MEKQKKTEKTDPLPPEKKYVYYVLCRKCHAVNVADPPGLCSKCLRNEPPRDNFRPKKKRRLPYQTLCEQMRGAAVGVSRQTGG
jgi:hypothetical protein